MNLNDFQDAIEIIDKIEQNGHQAFFVGGCVRDSLIGRPIGDIDITTSAHPLFIMELFDECIPVGIEHGTVIVKHGGNSYEVTTFRIDGKYTDHRHPDDVEFVDQLDKDLERRDFTINAIAMTKSGELIDLFDGKADISNKCIRTVGNGVERFKEDPLRIVRALRFSSQLGFSIEKNTLTAMIEVKSELRNLAIERISMELDKFFKGAYVRTGLRYLKETGVNDKLPVLYPKPSILDQLPEHLDSLHSLSELFVLFHSYEPDITISTWVKTWKCSNKIKKDAEELHEAIRYYNDFGLDRWLVYQLSSEQYPLFIQLVRLLYNDWDISEYNIVQIEAQLPIQSKHELEIKGNDVVSAFPHLDKGRWIQQMLLKIEKEIVMGNLENTSKMIKEWITCNPPEID